MDIIAIDFETANHHASSACQLAAVVVRESQIVSEHSWLIRPPRMYFSPRNIEIHGIRPDDVRESPTMEKVWSELSQLLEGQVLVAHNARFDISVLVASLEAFDLACPALQFTCTRMLARAAWPGRSGYGLKPLGDWLGVQFRHHDALEDARCCAHIALTIEQLYQHDDLSELERQLQVTRGSYRHSTITSPRSLRKKGRVSNAGGEPMSTDRWGFPTRRRTQLGAIDPHEVVAAAAEQKPLSGKCIVLLGPLRGLDMHQSHELITQLGGQCQLQIEATTDYVIACGHSLADAKHLVNQTHFTRSPTPSSPTQAPSISAAADTSPSGIRLLSERQFRSLLPGGKASASW